MINKVKYSAGAAAFLGVLVLLVFYRNDVSAGIYKGISYSLSVLIPSIMPFMFVSGLFTITRPAKVLCYAMKPVSRYVFRVSPAAAPAIIFGLTCGYPVGAKLTADLLKQEKITKEEAGRLLAFTLNPGIPFCVLFLGGSVLKNTGAGLGIYLSITLGNILIGSVMALKAKFPQAKGIQASYEDFTLAIKKSADSTIRACLNMSFFIVVFWGAMALMHKCGLFASIVRLLPLPFWDGMEKAGMLSFFFEVTGGISDSAVLRLPLCLFAAGLGFGGICIHLQLFSFFPQPPLGWGRFLFWRFVHSGLSLLIYNLIGSRTAAQAVSLEGSRVFSGIQGSFSGCLCLILLFITYVIITSKESVEKPRKT